MQLHSNKSYYIFILSAIVLLLASQLFNQMPSQYLSRAYRKIVENNRNSPLQPYNWAGQGDYYTERLDQFYLKSKENYKIILLGNSIIEQGHWDSLLYKHDALNFGIGGDYTLGMLNRLNFVISKAPEICIVEGGINDIYINIPIDSILLNYKAIIKKLKANKIKAIIVSVTYTSINFNNSEVLNKKIKQFNILLKDISSPLFLDCIGMCSTKT